MNLTWVTTPWAIVWALAAFRLTVFVTRDSFPPMARVRDHVLDRWGDNPWSELIVCPWCMSIWIGPATTLVASSPAATGAQWAAVPLAMSAVAGLLASREEGANAWHCSDAPAAAAHGSSVPPAPASTSPTATASAVSPPPAPPNPGSKTPGPTGT